MAGRPNILYVFADQLRYSSCGYTSDPLAMTPHIDQFSRESLNFENAVSGHPVCAPYRASLFTGKYTTSTGMVINEIRMNPNHRSLAHQLRSVDYSTAYIGKWHMYANELGNHFDPKNSHIPPGPDRLGFDDDWAAYNFHHDYYGEYAYYHTDSSKKIYVEGYEPDAQTDLAIEKLKGLQNQDKPFAMFLSYGTPHDPWIPENVPEEYLKIFKDKPFRLPENYLDENDPYADDWAKLSREDRNKLTEWMKVYYAMTTNLDDNFGRLMQFMKESRLDENTIIIFTSDHGELFGAHGRRAKNIFYDEAVRVPFLMKWKNHIRENSTSDVCLNTVDIMPTLLSMLDIPIPEEVEGMDLSPIVFGKPGPEPTSALMMCTGATAVFEDGHEWRAIRNKQYTFAVYKTDGKELLFDNQNDPYQMKNLIDDPAYTAISDSMRTELYAKMNLISDTFESCSYYRDHWIKDRLILKTATLNTRESI